MFANLNQTIRTILYPFISEKFIFFDMSNNSEAFEEIFISEFIRDNNIKNIDWLRLALRKYYSKIYNNKGNKNEYIENGHLFNEICFENLAKLTKSLITIRDGMICYKYWENEDDSSTLGPYSEFTKVEIFRRINSIITMDTLAMYFLANIRNGNSDIDEIDGFYSYIKLADKQLDNILINGIAENHIHANAAFNFTFAWQYLMSNYIKINQVTEGTKYSSSLDYWNCEIKIVLKIASIIRLVLASFLSNECCHNNKLYETDDFEVIQELVNKLRISNRNFNYININEKILELKSYDFEETFNQILKNNGLSGDYNNSDIIFDIFKDSCKVKTYGENIFLFKCFEYQRNLKFSNDSDCLFSELFINYIRLKNYFYGTFVEGYEIKGLDRFQEFYKNSTNITWLTTQNIQSNDKEYYKKLIRSEFQNENLKYVELRIALKEKETDTIKTYIDILKAYREIVKSDFDNINFPRIGLIYHLIKNDELLNKENFYKTSVKNLIKVRNENIYNSYFIVGIDAASLENNTQIQSLIPAFLSARGSENDYLKKDDGYGNVVNVKTLGFTFHAGEDFRDMVSGLRRIDEVVRKFKYHAGDRIGHGTVLGLNVDKWASDNPVVLLPREEYLYNLLWVWNKISKYSIDKHSFSIYLEKNIFNIAREIFEENVEINNTRNKNNKIKYNLSGLSIPMLYELYRNSFIDIENIDASDKQNKISFRSIKLENDTEYKEALEEPIYISIDTTLIEIIKEMQRIMVEYIAQRGIIVEINPSSNTTIGEFESVMDNHSLTLNKIEELSEKNVIITINSDDPMIFNTTLSNEYAYIYYSLLSKGVSKERILEWIEKIRKYSIETSFVERKISDKKYLEYLDRIIDKF
ncbi:MAG: hypothetical protein ACRC57_13830 [Sarcina sp.]